MMQLKAIGLWNTVGDLRRIDLHPGSLNVVTGESETGKSTLIDIVRWCLGGEKLRVPDGPIAQTVTQFGLLLDRGESLAFVGRPMPTDGAQTDSHTQLEIGVEDFPAYADLRANTNRDGLRDWLASTVGIEENLTQVGDESTRASYPASFAHALIYCFLRQDEIASQRHLFHQQSEPFMPQAIKDTLPYFLGATGTEDIERRHQLRRETQALRRAQRTLDGAESELEHGTDRAAALLSEAAEVGLASGAPLDLDLTSYRSLLAVALDAPGLAPLVGQRNGDQWQRLQRERDVLSDRARRLQDQRDLLRTLATDDDAFSFEANEQATRLQSLHLLHEIEDAQLARCPVCASELEDVPPTVREMMSSLHAIDEQLSSVARERPQLVGAQQHVVDEADEVRRQLDENRTALEALAAQDSLVTRHQDQVNLQSYVRGRIDQFLEGSQATEPDQLRALREDVAARKARVRELRDRLDPARTTEGVVTRLNRVGHDMTAWAQQLDLEHSQLGVRIDAGRLTVVADGDDGPIAMDTSIGSGKNWVGYHLVSYLALQKWFLNHARPVPGFIIFDQPTQAFYRPEQLADDVVDADHEAALAQFELMRDIVALLDGRLQVIVLDHADYDTDWFEDAVVARWRGGQKLIPQTWIDGEQRQVPDQ